MLKTISVVFCTGLFAAALSTGCKKDDAAGGGACDDIGARAKADSLKKAPKDLPDDMKKMASDMADKASAMIVKHCKDDKWSDAVISCAKTADDPKTCMDKLTSDQQAKLMDDMSKMMGGMGGMKKPDDTGTTAASSVPTSGGGSASASGSGAASASGSGSASASGTAEASGSGSGSASASGAAPAAGGTGLANCDAYVAAIDKFAKCDKAPQAARDAAKQSIDAMKSSWANISSMPDSAKKSMDDGCKQGVDALAQGAKAMGCDL